MCKVGDMGFCKRMRCLKWKGGLGMVYGAESKSWWVGEGEEVYADGVR